jgi:alkaline phosphatase D
MAHIGRRTFLVGGLAVAGATALPQFTSRAAAAPISAPFKCGVASGDPSPDGFVLWTRLAPTPTADDGHGGMPNRDVIVEWQLATDTAFSTTSVVASGEVTASYDTAHSVHVELTGLPAGRVYYYRFRAEGNISPVGTTRTMPAAGALTPFSIAFASCAHYEQGYFHAYRRMADDHPDLILFLGDYIYERHTSSGAVRTYAGAEDEAYTLAHYRQRHAQHRSDASLQAAHAVAPWLPVFDDHEVENNWASAYRNDSTPSGIDWAKRKADAFQAWYENMPVRLPQKPNSSAIQLYRRLRWGGLATFHLLDTRQFRAKQVSASTEAATCSGYRDTARTITGAAQEQWLLNGFAERAGVWDVLGQQVFFAGKDTDGNANTCTDESNDQWAGYAASRDRITQGWIDRQVRNPLVLTGDIHNSWACNLRKNYFDHSSPYVGAELVGTSISSSGSAPSSTLLANNPHLTFVSNDRGYVRVRFTPSLATAEFVKVSNVTQADVTKAVASVVRTYAIEDGVPGLTPA